ncbi:pyridoxal phosphate-dependent decarboxylase family protein [Nocardia sp. NPDC003345]
MGLSVSQEFVSPWQRTSRFAEPGAGWSEVGGGLAQVAAAVADAHHHAPLPSGAPEEVLAAVAGSLGPERIPDLGVGEAAALARLAELVARYGLDLTHKLTAAHLQPPPLTVAVVADALASATNASLDTYDSGPATLAIEQWTINALARLAGFTETAGGVFGPGGSYSNLLALLIARDYGAARLGIDIRHNGTSALPRPVVLCSQIAHFSIHRACATLGLGEAAVIGVPVDAEHRMIPEALEAALAELSRTHTPMAIVATAGTTDFGSIDPLPRLADIAARYGVWLHVDAAYGFGSLFSAKLSGLLAGIERADSVTLDLHKVGWQPAAASVLLLADQQRFASLNRSVAYLNPDDDVEAGYGGLLGQTLQTTRRPDVLKVAATFLAYGRSGLGDMLDACHDLARYAEGRIAAEPQLELVAPVTLTTVVFRYRCEDLDLDQVNGELRRRLLSNGKALIGRTQVRVHGEGEPRTCLKLTLLNPEAAGTDIDALFDELLRVGLEVESEGLRSDHDEMVRVHE